MPTSADKKLIRYVYGPSAHYVTVYIDLYFWTFAEHEWITRDNSFSSASAISASSNPNSTRIDRPSTVLTTEANCLAEKLQSNRIVMRLHLSLTLILVILFYTEISKSAKIRTQKLGTFTQAHRVRVSPHVEKFR